MNPVLISKTVFTKSATANRHVTMGLAVLATAAFALASTSCATTKGFGHDVKKVGNKIENKAAQTGGAN
jgi:predicted small secreted protein